MISRLFLATLLAASLAAIGAEAHAQAPAAPAASPVVIPPNKCVKPEYPGKLGSSQKFTAFNKDFNANGECIKKYVDETKLIINAAATAGNGAVEEFNKFAADVKAQDEAGKN
jgi:hypothetical protein